MNAMKLLIYLFTLGILVLNLFSCSKASGKDWIVADIYVVDAVTGKPIQTQLSLRYAESGGVSQTYEEIYSIGATDVQGFKHIEHDVLGGQINFKVKVLLNGYYGPYDINSVNYQDVPISIKGSNIKTVELQPRYPVILNLKNANCTAPDDTLWLSLSETAYSQVFVGCVDSLVSSSYGFIHYLDTPQLTYTITTKKSGIVNSYSQTFNNLLPAEITSIQLDY